jgi:hypothetical protein
MTSSGPNKKTRKVRFVSPRHKAKRTRKIRRAPTPYLPPKYFAGLSAAKKTQRRREIARFGSRHWRDPKAYKGFTTDKGVITRTSKYVETLKRTLAKRGVAWEDVGSLEAKARVTGVPLATLQASYDRGMAAWRTGHRPGATQQQWGHARVASLLVCGKTHHTTDADLVRDAKAASASARAWWKSMGC